MFTVTKKYIQLSSILLVSGVLFSGCLAEPKFSNLNDLSIPNLPSAQIPSSPSKIPGPINAVPVSPSETTPVSNTPPLALGDGVWIEVTAVKVDLEGQGKPIQIKSYMGRILMEAISHDILGTLGNPELPKGKIERILIMTSDSLSEVIEGGKRTCTLSIPSGSASGIKIHFNSVPSEQLKLQKYGFSFSMHGDQNKNGDVIFQGNGKCSLHPEYSEDVGAQNLNAL
jgi:hypothetical protein